MTEITVGELLAKCQTEDIEMMFGIIDGAHIPFSIHASRYRHPARQLPTRRARFTWRRDIRGRTAKQAW